MGYNEGGGSNKEQWGEIILRNNCEAVGSQQKIKEEETQCFAGDRGPPLSVREAPSDHSSFF